MVFTFPLYWNLKRVASFITLPQGKEKVLPERYPFSMVTLLSPRPLELLNPRNNSITPYHYLSTYLPPPLPHSFFPPIFIYTTLVGEKSLSWLRTSCSGAPIWLFPPLATLIKDHARSLSFPHGLPCFPTGTVQSPLVLLVSNSVKLFPLPPPPCRSHTR